MDSSRTINLIGKKEFEKLENSNIILFGLGGVGGYVAEGLIRAGVKNLTIVDRDIVSPSNLNRQIIATSKTIGQNKTDVLKRRLNEINEEANITALKLNVDTESIQKIDFSPYNFVVDAIDDVSAKVLIIKKAYDQNKAIISSMGTGNKLHPEKFCITTIEKTSVCPLAKVMRKRLKDEEIKNIPVLFSTEEPQKSSLKEDGKIIPASLSTTVGVAGLMIANYVILKITNKI